MLHERYFGNHLAFTRLFAVAWRIKVIALSGIGALSIVERLIWLQSPLLLLLGLEFAQEVFDPDAIPFDLSRFLYDLDKILSHFSDMVGISNSVGLHAWILH
jgi:hypothetical protein